MSDVWDRAVTFDSRTPDHQIQETLIKITSKMGKDGTSVYGVKGPYFHDDGYEVWVLKVQAAQLKEEKEHD